MVIGRHFTKYYFKYFITFFIGLIALIAVDYFQLLLPEVVGGIVDGIEAGQKGLPGNLTKEVLLGYVKTLIMIVLVVFIGRFIWRICIFGNGIKIETDIRNEMFIKIEKLSTTYYSTNKTGALMSLFTNDLSLIRRSFGSGTMMLIDAVAMGGLAFYKMFTLSKKLAIICLIPLILVSAFTVVIDGIITKRSKKYLEAFEKLSDFVQEDFSGISVIKAFVKEKRMEFLFGPLNKENADTAFAFTKLNSLVNIIIDFALNTMMLTIIFVGGIYIARGSKEFSVGSLITFYSYFMSLIWPVMAVGDLITLRGQSIAGERRVRALLDEKIDINDLNCKYPDLLKDDIKGKIEFRDVSFTYPSSPIPSLTNVNFVINEGEMVGIMGATGSGKSTIVELMLRLYNLDDNKILIDDFDIMKMPLKTVRDAIAYVPQETFLFKQSIDANISFSLDEIDKEKNLACAHAAGIHKDIEGFPEYYDTILGERGVTVSGGQKQRIAIARALVKDAPILILDDSLSAVDTITERHILKSLKELRGGKTTIIIAHRITTLENLDKILVVEDGTVTNIGTHEELLEKSSVYKKEVRLQELEKELGGYNA